WELSRIFGPAKARDGLAALIEATGTPGAAASAATGHTQLVASELLWYMRNQLLRDTDWSSMAHSLEVRTPFVDYRLLEALAPLIVSAKPPTKRELFEPFKAMLPALVASRAKT